MWFGLLTNSLTLLWKKHTFKNSHYGDSTLSSLWCIYIQCLHSYPLTYSILWCLTSLNLNLTHLHTIPFNDKVKTCFQTFLPMYWKLYIEISHWHKYSHPWVNTLQRPIWKRLQLWVFLGKSLRDFHTWIMQHLPIIIFKIPQALSNWLLIIARQPFSSLTIDSQVDLRQNCNSATQEHSLSFW